MRAALITVALLMIVGFFLLPQLGGSSRSRLKMTQVGMQNIAAASRQYYAEYGTWPHSILEFYPTNNPRHLPLLIEDRRAANDAWGRPLIYRPFDTTVGYGSIISFGRDGKPGGEGLDKDIEVRFPEHEQAATSTVTLRLLAKNVEVDDHMDVFLVVWFC